LPVKPEMDSASRDL